MTWQSVSQSHVGSIREINEDRYYSNDETEFWLIADGMGGHEQGDYASQLIIDGFAQCRLSTKFIGERLSEIKQILFTINNNLLAYSLKHKLQTVGSTVAILTAINRQVLYVWLGDSRIYLCREGKLTQLTQDHSVVEEMVLSGEISLQEAGLHEISNQLTRAVGAEEALNISFGLLETLDADIFLICSDGLTSVQSTEDIRMILQEPPFELVTQRLIDLSLDRRVPDNVTVSAIRFN